jgi:hypothetical protein
MPARILTCIAFAVALASCGGQVTPGAGDADCNANDMYECCGAGTPSHGFSCEQDYGSATCGMSGWTCPSGGSPEPGCSGICIGDPGFDGNFEEDAATDATVDAADARSEPVRYDVCGYPFAVDPEAGADAGAYTLTSEDVSCTTTADCVVQSCRSCCSVVEVGVNKASTYECATVACPAPSNAPPMGCPPEAILTEDCQQALYGVGVACVGRRCTTFAIPADAGDGG